MKLMFLILALFLVSNSYGQQSNERAKILKVLETQRLGWNDGNLNTYMQGFAKTDSLLYIGNMGIISGWQNTLNYYAKSYPSGTAMGTLFFDIKQVDLLDENSAFVLGTWRLKRANDEPGGYFTQLFKKINDQWLIVINHVK